MSENKNTNVSEKLKKIIKEKIEPQSTILEFANSKLYIAYSDTDFEYTNLEGYLCVVVNRKIPTLYLHLYEYINYRKEFEIELYTNIEKGYSILHENFHCIEYENFYLGINFASKIAAENLKNCIIANSTIFNFPIKQFYMFNSKKIEADLIRDKNITHELNKVELKYEKSIKFVNLTLKDGKDVNYEINKEEFDKGFYKLGFNSNYLDSHNRKIKNLLNLHNSNSNISHNNLNSKKISFLDKHLSKINESVSSPENKKFIQFDSSKRKLNSNIESSNEFPNFVDNNYNLSSNTILDPTTKSKPIERASVLLNNYDKEYIRSAMTNVNDKDKRQSLKHMIHMQV